MIPPLILELKFVSERNQQFSLWLPLIIIWPFVGILFVAILPFAYIVECFLSSRGIRPFSILLVFLEIICSLRGLDIDVKSKKVNNNTSVKILFI
jgi:hypothetical protein